MELDIVYRFNSEDDYECPEYSKVNKLEGGFVGDDLTTGKSTVWKVIKNGVPAMLKQGFGGRFFNGKENGRFEGVLHTLQEWITDEQKLEFLRKFGWLMKDEGVKAYSAKFKPKK